MDKNAIKKYAIWARNELIAKVSQKAAAYGIEKDNIVDANADSIDGVMLSSVEKKQRKALIEQINEKGYEQVIEEVAYTWFNRFTAIRFMEVNGYLPSHIRVFTDDDNNFKPQILTEAIHLNDIFEKINMEKVLELKQENKTEELYKYLLIVQCNALNDVIPRMFQKIEDYSELLLPDYLLREGSVLEQLVTLIPEEDWKDQVQIIGWLYQYYNSEPKDAVFVALKKNVKISKENIPAATQLFTPDWIVRYMVENSLGRLWLEGHPNDDLKSEWKYYLDEAEQEEEVQKQLDEIRKEYAQLKPEDIKCIDPCMGSGHILCYMFDVLVKIYEDYGYTARDAASSIVKNNLWGLDIDERAAQLSNFAVMMKARQYDRRFFSRNIQPHVYSMEESNEISVSQVKNLGINLPKEDREKAIKDVLKLLNQMYDAKEYGSIIHIEPCDWELLRRFAISESNIDGQLVLDLYHEVDISEKIQALVNIGELLSQKYHAVITNPPYMNASGMCDKLSKYVKQNYSDSKSDLFAVFIEKCSLLTLQNYYTSMITQQSWMFLSSFEKLRGKINDIINMAHLGARAFDEIGGEVVQTTSFVIRQSNINEYQGVYYRLIDESSENKKEEAFLKKNNEFISSKDKFDAIPGSPVAYWLNDKFVANFCQKKIGDVFIPKFGMSTGDGERFIRFWYEVNYSDLTFSLNNSIEAESANLKWVPIDKGGTYRKWFGNRNCVVWWKNNGVDIKNHKKSAVRSPHLFFKPHTSWTLISSGHFSARYFENGFALDTASNCIYSSDDQFDYVLALLNSCVADEYLAVLNPTMNFSCGVISLIPYIEKNYDQIVRLSKENKKISKDDWDSFEISWSFKRHPLVPEMDIKSEKELFVSDCYNDWALLSDNRFNDLKKNEEMINSLFIDIYGLQDDLLPDVDDKYITVERASLSRDIRSLISYAVGCMFGRYSLDEEGIIFAGGRWEESRYKSFKPDDDAIIPICDDEYFEDDIVNRFIKFIEIVYGKSSLEANLSFIAKALGGKGSSRDIIRNYFINDFYNDHIKLYQKRPIYWLFDSGKKNGFKCLIYIHRYKNDTIARIRTDYVHEQQSRYRTAIIDLEQRIDNLSTGEKVKMNKKLNIIKDQEKELKEYEEKIHHLADKMIDIDIDNGIKKNYMLLIDVLRKI